VHFFYDFEPSLQGGQEGHQLWMLDYFAIAIGKNLQ